MRVSGFGGSGGSGGTNDQTSVAQVVPVLVRAISTKSVTVLRAVAVVH
jgi:hypothetical protein